MRRVLWTFVILTMSGCVVTDLEVAPVDTASDTPIEVNTPVKAHLNDGSTVVFAEGITVANGVVSGDGEKYDIKLEESAPVTELAVEEIAAIESYQTPVSQGATAAASAGTTVGAVVLATGLAMALFGSCPTVYAMDAGEAVLEAELFSYSIAPVFQARDMDKLGLRAPANGLVELDVRNEMLETHYIDQLELVEVSHAAGFIAYPDEKGRPVAARNLVTPVSAVDQDGRDLLTSIRVADHEAWETPQERLQAVAEDDHVDYVDLEFDVPDGTTDPALVLTLRNSLLNTVLLYDVMLKGQSYGALDWLGEDLNRFSNYVRTGLWYRNTMGLEISVWNGNRYRKVAKLPDQGPIAWAERAIELPEPRNGKLKVRLSYVSDNWRFDRIALALQTGDAQIRRVPVASAKTSGEDRPGMVEMLSRADEEYLITRPGDSVRVVFDAGEAEPGTDRGFFLASEGYYMEWMRSDWLTEERRPPFKPGVDALLAAIDIHTSKRDGFRELFEATKIKIR